MTRMTATEPGARLSSPALLRIPPHSIDVEQAVLGIPLLEGAGVLPKIASALVASDFYLEAHRTIFDTMLAMGAADVPIDILTVTERLRQQGDLEAVGGQVRLTLLMQAATIAANLPAYLEILRAHAIRREVIQDGERRVSEAYAGETPAAALVEAWRVASERLERRVGVGGALFTARSLGELRREAIPAPSFHLDGWIPTKGLSFIVGDSGAYKSWFAQYLGLCVAAGRPVFDRLGVRQAPVLYISEENGLVEDRRRSDLLCTAHAFADDVPFFIGSETAFSFDDPARYAALRAFLEAHHVELVIVDSFVRVHRREEKDAGAMNALYLDRMRPLIRDGVDLVLLHHKRKLPAGLHNGASASSDNDDIRGSGDLRAAAHAVLFLKTLSPTHVVVRHNKVRGARLQEPFVFSLVDVDGGAIRLTYEGKPEDTLDRSAACKAAVLAYAGEHPGGFYRQALIDKLRGTFSRKVIQPALKALARDGYPLKVDEHQQGRARRFFYTLVSGAPDPADDAGGGTDDVPF